MPEFDIDLSLSVYPKNSFAYGREKRLVKGKMETEKRWLFFQKQNMPRLSDVVQKILALFYFLFFFCPTWSFSILKNGNKNIGAEAEPPHLLDRCNLNGEHCRRLVDELQTQKFFDLKLSWLSSLSLQPKTDESCKIYVPSFILFVDTVVTCYIVAISNIIF